MGFLSDLLAARRARILERWTERIQREHLPEGASHGELWNELPLILDELLAALRALDAPPPAAPRPADTAASARHGAQRLRVGFDVEQVVREYAILAEVLLDEVEVASAPLHHYEWRVALRAVTRGIAESVAAYVRRRDAELRRQTGRHVAFVAHELRNPLMSARAAAAALRLAPADERLCAALDRSLRRLGALVDDVVTADRLASGLELRRERVELAALLQAAVEDVRAAAESRDVKIVLERGPGGALAGDRRLLDSAVGNLMSNAVKFTVSGSTVRVRTARSPAAVTLEIQDECGGLPPGDPGELFEPFVQRGDNRTGLGLGLAIVRQAVAAHGGEVSVRNAPGQGCTFVVTLPAEDFQPA
jgi:signal transduction histidine kinase